MENVTIAKDINGNTVVLVNNKALYSRLVINNEDDSVVDYKYSVK